MLQSSRINTYYPLNFTKFPIPPKMMGLTIIHWLQGKRMTNIVMMRSPLGEIVTHNHNLMMMMASLGLRTMLFTQEIMVDES